MHVRFSTDTILCILPEKYDTFNLTASQADLLRLPQTSFPSLRNAFSHFSAELAEVFQERKTVLKKSSDAEFVAITKDRSEYSEEIISVILNEGDIAGGVIFLQKNEKKHFGEMEKKFAAGAADLLGRQLS